MSGARPTGAPAPPGPPRRQPDGSLVAGVGDEAADDQPGLRFASGTSDCPACGYDLLESVFAFRPRCPECGRSIELAVHDPRRGDRRSPLLVAVLMLPVATAGFLGYHAILNRIFFGFWAIADPLSVVVAFGPGIAAGGLLLAMRPVQGRIETAVAGMLASREAVWSIIIAMAATTALQWSWWSWMY